MRSRIGALQPFRRDMCVNLRCGKAGMAEQGLDASQIGTVVEQMCGEAVTKLMRAKVRWQGRILGGIFSLQPKRNVPKACDATY